MTIWDVGGAKYIKLFFEKKKTLRWKVVITLTKRDKTYQWTFFSYIVIFYDNVDKICRKSICNWLMLVSGYYSLNFENKHDMKLVSTLWKSHTNLCSQRSFKETNQNVVKLFK